MNVNEYIHKLLKENLEKEYLGETIEVPEWMKGKLFKVNRIEIPKDIDSYFEIFFYDEDENLFIVHELPKIIKEEKPEEENLDLSNCENCENCGVHAWNGRICHSCGAKNI